MKSGLLTIAVVLGLAASPAQAADVPRAVYDCFGRSMAAGRGSDVGVAGRDGRASYISEGAGRGAVGGSASEFSGHRSRNLSQPRRGGATGHFTFDGKTMEMTNGPYSELKSHKVDGFWTFRMLFLTGDEGPVMCPQNLAKDAHTPNKW